MKHQAQAILAIFVVATIASATIAVRARSERDRLYPSRDQGRFSPAEEARTVAHAQATYHALVGAVLLKENEALAELRPESERAAQEIVQTLEGAYEAFGARHAAQQARDGAQADAAQAWTIVAQAADDAAAYFADALFYATQAAMAITVRAVV